MGTITNKKLTLFLCSCLCLFLVTGCADSYQQEVKKVLQHYSANPADSLKLKAAEFLVEHIPSHYFYTGKSVEVYYSRIDSILAIDNEENPYLQIDAFDEHLSDIPLRNLIAGKDKDEITADYLIGHIDSCFKIFEYPWNKDLTFRNFCEYVLPYRYKHEPVENWRPLYHNYFASMIDSLRHKDLSSYEVCELLWDHLSEHEDIIGFTLLHTFRLDLPPSQLLELKRTRCYELTARSVFAMRAFGLPVSGDFTPQWGKRSLGHDWNVLLNQDSLVTYQLGDEEGFGSHIKSKIEFDRLTKVFRNMFSIQKESLAYLNNDKEEIPARFRNPFIKDVTEDYLPVTDIEVDIIRDRLKKKYAYLMVFDNQKWQPVDWGEIKKDKAYFKKIPSNCMYAVMLYEKGEFIPVANPFYLTDAGEMITYNPDPVQTQEVTLYRKYPLTPSIWHVLHVRMINGRFEVANKADFSDAITIHTITDPEGPIKRTIKPDLHKPYRYFRYMSPDWSFVNMAEMEIFSADGEKLAGEVIGTEGSYNNRRGFDKYAAFDGDILSFFDAPDPYNSWVGMDFGKPEQIGHFIYIPRNDDNDVNEGEMYELFYFDKGWISLGRKIGTSNQSVVYKNVPLNALLWLRNHTKGKEERVFLFEEGRQVWW